MANSRDNLIEVLPAVNINQNGTQSLIHTEMTSVNVARDPAIADELAKKESTINDILQKNGKAVSSTGFSAILFVNNATEVRFGQCVGTGFKIVPSLVTL